jgi:hypothetical protein
VTSEPEHASDTPNKQATLSPDWKQPKLAPPPSNIRNQEEAKPAPFILPTSITMQTLRQPSHVSPNPIWSNIKKDDVALSPYGEWLKEAFPIFSEWSKGGVRFTCILVRIDGVATIALGIPIFKDIADLPRTEIPIIWTVTRTVVEFTYNGRSTFLNGRIERLLSGCPIQFGEGYGTFGGYVKLRG